MADKLGANPALLGVLSDHQLTQIRTETEIVRANEPQNLVILHPDTGEVTGRGDPTRHDITPPIVVPETFY
jgi:hypothetical protein